MRRTAIASLFPVALGVSLQGCVAQHALRDSSVAVTVRGEDLGHILSSQNLRSQVCTGLKDGRAGFSGLAAAGYRDLQQGDSTDSISAKWTVADAKGAIASDLAKQALRVAAKHPRWDVLSSEEQSKVLCFTALSSYDNFLADNPKVLPDERDLLGVADRVFTTLADLAQ